MANIITLKQISNRSSVTPRLDPRMTESVSHAACTDTSLPGPPGVLPLRASGW